MKENFKKYLVEFIGTFFLVFTVLNVVYYGKPGIVAPLAIGFALMVCVYAGGHISGGHYNPAVSLAAAIRGALDWKQLAPYWLAQIIGGAVAVGIMAIYVEFPELMPVEIPLKNVFGGEFLFTFLLCYVVLLTATSPKTEGNSFYGFAIGSTVTIGAIVAGGSLCYAAFNPAVAISLGMFNVSAWGIVVLTILSNLVAGACAAYVYKFVEE